MIIFDLDGTLADCEHRRHFVDGTRSTPDWKSFYEACDEDEPIEAVSKIFDDLAVDNEIEIWSGRCESVREKTLEWFCNYIPYSGQKIKMRPIGDNTPDDQLKERWLDEVVRENRTIEFVFDDRPKVVRMWRRRGIFVFDCNQSGKEF